MMRVWLLYQTPAFRKWWIFANYEKAIWTDFSKKRAHMAVRL